MKIRQWGSRNGKQPGGMNERKGRNRTTYFCLMLCEIDALCSFGMIQVCVVVWREERGKGGTLDVWKDGQMCHVCMH